MSPTAPKQVVLVWEVVDQANGDLYCSCRRTTAPYSLKRHAPHEPGQLEPSCPPLSGPGHFMGAFKSHYEGPADDAGSCVASLMWQPRAPLGAALKKTQLSVSQLTPAA